MVRRTEVCQKAEELKRQLAPSGYFLPSEEAVIAMEAVSLLEKVCEEGLE